MFPTGAGLAPKEVIQAKSKQDAHEALCATRKTSRENAARRRGGSSSPAQDVFPISSLCPVSVPLDNENQSFCPRRSLLLTLLLLASPEEAPCEPLPALSCSSGSSQRCSVLLLHLRDPAPARSCSPGCAQWESVMLKANSAFPSCSYCGRHISQALQGAGQAPSALAFCPAGTNLLIFNETLGELSWRSGIVQHGGGQLWGHPIVTLQYLQKRWTETIYEA